MWFFSLKLQQGKPIGESSLSLTKEKAVKPVKAILQQGATVFQSSLGLKLCSNTVTVLYMLKDLIQVVWTMHRLHCLNYSKYVACTLWPLLATQILAVLTGIACYHSRSYHSSNFLQSQLWLSAIGNSNINSNRSRGKKRKFSDKLIWCSVGVSCRIGLTVCETEYTLW